MERYRSGEKALTVEQTKILLNNPELSLFDEGLLRLAVTGGLRRGDIVAVRKDGLDGHQLKYFERKKRGRLWTCYLPASTVQVLNQLRKTSKGPWMFPQQANSSKHICSKTAYNILQRRLTEVGLHSIPFHALRATCIKLAQRRGWTVEQTAKHVGDTVRVIQEHYAVPSQMEMAEVVSQKAIL